MFAIRRLDLSDAPAFRHVRLEHLKNHPAGAASAWEDEADQPLSWFEQRLAQNATFGGFLEEGATLAGIAGLFVPPGRKMKHKGMLVGMYVAPAARGTGLSRALIDAVLTHARTVVEEVQLHVDPDNEAALRLYRATGFEEYGREPRELKIGDEYRDAVLMTLRFPR